MFPVSSPAIVQLLKLLIKLLPEETKLPEQSDGWFKARIVFCRFTVPAESIPPVEPEFPVIVTLFNAALPKKLSRAPAATSLELPEIVQLRMFSVPKFAMAPADDVDVLA